jgi:uncharacterized membrane protein
VPIALPDDFDVLQGVAILFLFAAWFTYSTVLGTISRGSLNRQLSTVRAEWLRLSIRRAQRPFDAILLGNIVNSIAFFGSATMIVIAGVVTLFVNVKSVHRTTEEVMLTGSSSLALFVIHVTVLTVILALCFFAFTYALRKLIYVLALVGGLPDGELSPHAEACRLQMVDNAATVLSEALVTFNFGIRGYYYALAGLGLFVSPWLSMLITFVATFILMYRQIGTKTAAAVQNYVDLLHSAQNPPGQANEKSGK